MSRIDSPILRQRDQPYGSIMIDPNGSTLVNDISAVADIEPGMFLNYTSSGFDRVDAAADTKIATYVSDIPELPTGAKTDPETDYNYEANEMVKAWELAPGARFYIRCSDNNTITKDDLLELDTTNQGEVKKWATTNTATITTGTTAVLGTAADGTGDVGIVLAGEPQPVAKFKALATRAASATESWLPVEYLGR